MSQKSSAWTHWLLTFSDTWFSHCLVYVNYENMFLLHGFCIPCYQWHCFGLAFSSTADLFMFVPVSWNNAATTVSKKKNNENDPSAHHSRQGIVFHVPRIPPVPLMGNPYGKALIFVIRGYLWLICDAEGDCWLAASRWELGRWSCIVVVLRASMRRVMWNFPLNFWTCLSKKCWLIEKLHPRYKAKGVVFGSLFGMNLR